MRIWEKNQKTFPLTIKKDYFCNDNDKKKMKQRIIISNHLQQQLATALAQCKHDKTFIIADENTTLHCLLLRSIWIKQNLQDTEYLLTALAQWTLNVLTNYLQMIKLIHLLPKMN